MPAETNTTRRVPVSERSLIARINRRLQPDNRQLHKSRSARALFDLGGYYVRDWYLNVIVEDHVDIEQLGQELGVLHPWERLDQGSAPD